MIRDVELFDQLPSTLHRLVRKRLVPAEERVQKRTAHPPEIVAEICNLGLFGMTIPRNTAAWALHGRRGSGLDVSGFSLAHRPTMASAAWDEFRSMIEECKIETIMSGTRGRPQLDI